jgi:fatty-acyl-CoA synthase
MPADLARPVPVRAPAARWINYHARAAPDRIAAIDASTGRQSTYAELDDRIRRLAAVLSAQYAVSGGDRVAMLSGNRVEAIELMYACAELGSIFVPLNIRLTAHELHGLIEDCSPRVLVGEKELLTCDLLGRVPRANWDEVDAAGADVVATGAPVDLDGEAPWLIIYTSGTTGVPKGVIITHAGSHATMLASVVSGRVTAHTVCLTALPLWHVAALNLFTNPTLFMGGSVIVMSSFDAAHAGRLLTDSRTPVTHFTGVPAHYQFMDAVLGEKVLPNFVAAVGGSPVPVELIERWARRGVELRPVYGITEAGSTVAMVPAGASPGAPGDVGVPMSHIQCRIETTGSDEAGELLIRGPSVTPGYWNRPDDTARTVIDGWLHTGDIATISSDGCIRIIDRLKDMYISGGENVYPAEVEDVLSRHPAVACAAVVGVPDEKWGETGSAWLVLDDHADLQDADALRTWLRERLGAFKVPRYINIVDTLPRNATGKVLKEVLRRRSVPVSRDPWTC